MEARTVWERRIDKRLGVIDAAARQSQHPLDNCHDRLTRHDEIGAHVSSFARDEHTALAVYPDLLDGRIV